MCLCLISLLIEKKMDALRLLLLILLLKTLVPVSFIVPQDLAKKTTKFVLAKESSRQMIHQYLLTKTENSLTNAQFMKEFT